MLTVVVLVLTGCAEREPKVITPPKEAAAVIAPFLKEMAAGNKDKAAAYVSPAAQDELNHQFAEDHKRLAKAGELTPRFSSQRGNTPEQIDANSDADGSEVTVVYAAKVGDSWATATVRVYKYRDDPYKVEYWQVNNKPPAKPQLNMPETKELRRMEAIQNATIVGLALLGLCGILLLVWLAQRKPHLLVPAEDVEKRKAATTIRDEED